jgi:NadR type nicotinamide-nucleotide adenylyltransferase
MRTPLRIVLFGPESTGKSTLAAALAARYRAPYSSEYVREYWDANDGVITAADLDAIGRGQVAAEEKAVCAATATGAQMVFHDTDLLTCLLWNDLLFPGACPPWVRVDAERRARTMDLYLYCDTDMSWIADSQRCFSDQADREMCRGLWRNTLDRLGLRWAEVSGDWAQREALAVSAVDAAKKQNQM